MSFIELDEQTRETFWKHIRSISEILPDHMEKWNSNLQGAKNSLQILMHLREHHKAVRRAKLKHVPNYEERTKAVLLFCIEDSIEEIWTELQNNVTNLFKSTSVLTKKIHALKKYYADFFKEPGDYTSHPIFNGTPTVPSLPTLLAKSLEFNKFFAEAVDNIQNAFRNLQMYASTENDRVHDKYCKQLQASLDVDVNHRSVTYLIALTQYVRAQND